jgi:hypothetical protein
MNTAGVEDSLEQLSECLNDFQKNLQPLLTDSLAETTKKLPLLDRAQLYVLVVYAIESLLFCTILPCIQQTTDMSQHTSVSRALMRKSTMFSRN